MKLKTKLFVKFFLNKVSSSVTGFKVYCYCGRWILSVARSLKIAAVTIDFLVFISRGAGVERRE